MKTDTKIIVGSGILLAISYCYYKHNNLVSNKSDTFILPTGTLEFHYPKGPHGYGILGENISKGLEKAGMLRSNLPTEISDVTLQLSIPPNFSISKSKINIGFSMFEANKIPRSWHEGLKKLDMIIVPIKSNVNSFNIDNRIPIDVVPICIDTDIYNPNNPTLLNSDFFGREFQNIFKFLIINDGTSRKNNDIVLKAFMEEFYEEILQEKVLLVVRLRSIEYLPNLFGRRGIYHIDKYIDNLSLLIKSCDCLVSASSGECGDIPILQGMSMEKIVIISDDKLVHTETIEDSLNTGYGQTGFLIDIDIHKKAYSHREYSGRGYLEGIENDTIWHVPSISDLKRKMRYVYENRDMEQMNNIRKNASRYILENRNIDTMTNNILEILQSLKWSNIRNHTLSVCSFMKNEVSIVRNMLNSIKEINPDEIIVIDENSTDGTRDILRQYGVKIIDGKLNNDYSSIRNHAISVAKSDWILFVDADETLDNNLAGALEYKNGYRELTRFLEDNSYDSMAIGRKNYIDGHFSGDYPDYQARLLRNNGNIKYMNRVHETLYGDNKRYYGDENFNIIHSKTSARYIEANKRYSKMLETNGIVGLINLEHQNYRSYSQNTA